MQSARFTLDQRRIEALVDREAEKLTLPRIGALRFRVTDAWSGAALGHDQPPEICESSGGTGEHIM